ncbi:MAG: ParB/RepB/Spo0J family partition protein [candidate division WOR-3 bacterium]
MSRKALGKGLAAIVPEQTRVVAATEARQIPIADIRTNPYQPRGQPDRDLEELAASIKEHGVIQPIVVRRRHDGFELVVGERRLRAAHLAGLSTIPAVISDVDEPGMLELALIENVQRSDLSPIETALGYKRLVDEFNLTHDQVAAKVGKSRPSVTNALRLLMLPQKVRDALSAGQITQGHARALLGITNRQTQEQLCERIVAEGLSVRTVERICGLVPKTKRRTHPQPDPNLVALAESLQEHLGAKVKVREQDGRGMIAIEFRGLDELDRIAHRILGSPRSY